MADLEAEVKAETLGNTLSDAQALLDTMADSKAKVGAETLGDKLSVAQEAVETFAELHQHWPTRWLTRKHRWRQRR